MVYETYEETVAMHYRRFSNLSPSQILRWLEESRIFNYKITNNNSKRQKPLEQIERDLASIVNEIEKEEAEKARA